MKKRMLALLLAVCMLAGCAASSSEAASSEPQPVYTYQNSDPDMVLITSPSGDVTYADYRLYLNVYEEISRYNARQNLGFAALLERDFAKMGITINEEEFGQVAAQGLTMMSLNTPGLAENLEKISQETGLSEEELNDAMMLGYRLKYLSNLLQEHYYTLAEAKYPAESAVPEVSEAPSSSAAVGESSGEPASSEASSADPAAEAEAARQQAILQEVNDLMTQYSEEIGQRHSFDDESVLITIDGEKIPYTQQQQNYILFTALSDRMDAIAFIQEGEMELRELERRGTGIPRADFDTTMEQDISSVQADEQSMGHLTRFCAKFGATTDDYFKALERPMWLQYTGDVYYNLMVDEYNALPADAENRPASADEYYIQQVDRLLEGSEVVNIDG